MSKKPLDLKDPMDLDKLQSAAETVAYWLKNRRIGDDQWEQSLRNHIKELKGRLNPEWHTFHDEPPRELIPTS
jgi:hypothetical protein